MMKIGHRFPIGSRVHLITDPMGRSVGEVVQLGGEVTTNYMGVYLNDNLSYYIQWQSGLEAWYGESFVMLLAPERSDFKIERGSWDELQRTMQEFEPDLVKKIKGV